MRPSTTPCQSPNADALNGRHGFPPRIRASAGAGFGTGLCAAPFRQRPGICRCKARPSHTQCFLRLHPVSLAPMRQRPGLRFPIPHLESFPPHIRDLPVRASARAFVRPRFASVRASADIRPALPILNVSCACIRAALACPLSVDRDGFLSLSLSLTEGNAPPFGPIRGRQRNPPKHCPRPRRPLPGSPFSSRVPPRQAARAGLPVSEDIFRAYPRHAAKLMRNAGSGAEASPQAGGRGSAPSTITASAGRPPPEARQRFRTISKDGIRLGVSPHGNAAKATASCRHFPRLAYPDRRQRPAHAEQWHAAQRIPLRYAAKAAISAGHPPVIGIPLRHAAQVAHVLT